MVSKNPQHKGLPLFFLWVVPLVTPPPPLPWGIGSAWERVIPKRRREIRIEE
jgi:hypothetical protein